MRSWRSPTRTTSASCQSPASRAWTSRDVRQASRMRFWRKTGRPRVLPGVDRGVPALRYSGGDLPGDRSRQGSQCCAGAARLFGLPLEQQLPLAKRLAEGPLGAVNACEPQGRKPSGSRRRDRAPLDPGQGQARAGRRDRHLPHHEVRAQFLQLSQVRSRREHPCRRREGRVGKSENLDRPLDVEKLIGPGYSDCEQGGGRRPDRGIDINAQPALGVEAFGSNRRPLSFLSDWARNPCFSLERAVTWSAATRTYEAVATGGCHGALE
jgi:hypothetical protein